MHLFERADVRAALESVLGPIERLVDVGARSSHAAAVVYAARAAAFVKAGSLEEAELEVRCLRFIAERADVAVARPLGPGLLLIDDGALLLTEALDERLPDDRTSDDWASIGSTLATMHGVQGDHFGAPFQGHFGPLSQDNRPATTWLEFHVERRLLAWLATALAAGGVDEATAVRVHRLIERLPDISGPDVSPSLLHGDAQHHNFVSTTAGAVVIDASPYFGHPEVDLALIDYFRPVPDAFWEGYRLVRPIAEDFATRRELWRIHAYLAVLSVDSTSDFGRGFVGRLDRALAAYGC